MNICFSWIFDYCTCICNGTPTSITKQSFRLYFAVPFIITFSTGSCQLRSCLAFMCFFQALWFVQSCHKPDEGLLNLAHSISPLKSGQTATDNFTYTLCVSRACIKFVVTHKLYLLVANKNITNRKVRSFCGLSIMVRQSGCSKQDISHAFLWAPWVMIESV